MASKGVRTRLARIEQLLGALGPSQVLVIPWYAVAPTKGQSANAEQRALFSGFWPAEAKEKVLARIQQRIDREARPDPIQLEDLIKLELAAGATSSIAPIQGSDTTSEIES